MLLRTQSKDAPFKKSHHACGSYHMHLEWISLVKIFWMHRNIKVVIWWNTIMRYYSILHFIFEPDFNTGNLPETWRCPFRFHFRETIAMAKDLWELSCHHGAELIGWGLRGLTQQIAYQITLSKLIVFFVKRPHLIT